MATTTRIVLPTVKVQRYGNYTILDRGNLQHICNAINDTILIGYWYNGQTVTFTLEYLIRELIKNLGSDYVDLLEQLPFHNADTDITIHGRFPQKYIELIIRHIIRDTMNRLQVIPVQEAQQWVQRYIEVGLWET